MIKFQDVPYMRLNMDRFEQKFRSQLEEFKHAKSFGAAYYALLGLDRIRDEFSTLAVICEARNTMDVNDVFYKEETEFFDRVKPRYEALENEMNEALLESPYQKEFEIHIGTEPFRMAALHKESFHPEIMEELKQENELSSKYSEMIANLKAETEEGVVPLSKIGTHMGSEDRNERAKYAAIWEKSFASAGEELDDLYDRLVKVRDRIAKKLGKKSFTEVGYCRMGRTSYTRKDIVSFREEVKKNLVPVAQRLFEKQRQALGVEVLYHYDEDIFAGGKKPQPTQNILEDFQKVYRELSPETRVYYEELLKCEFFDLSMRPGKIMGAYSNYVAQYHMPFIFETYHATTGALKTFAHETGHGFHSYTKRGEPFSFSGACSSDLAEIHSMGMEFLVWPYLKYVLPEEEIASYCYIHLKNALSFIPYGCAIDEFQETIYDHPNLSVEDRKDLWKQLEKQYMPWKKYDTDLFLSKGRAWQRQTHVYRWPFYYIDYVLAQVCALELHFMDQENHETAWNCYKKILEYSGQKGFKETIESAGLPSPFQEAVIKELAQSVENSISWELMGAVI